MTAYYCNWCRTRLGSDSDTVSLEFNRENHLCPEMKAAGFKPLTVEQLYKDVQDLKARIAMRNRQIRDLRRQLRK